MQCSGVMSCSGARSCVGLRGNVIVASCSHRRRRCDSSVQFSSVLFSSVLFCRRVDVQRTMRCADCRCLATHWRRCRVQSVKWAGGGGGGGRTRQFNYWRVSAMCLSQDCLTTTLTTTVAVAASTFITPSSVVRLFTVLLIGLLAAGKRQCHPARYTPKLSWSVLQSFRSSSLYLRSPTIVNGLSLTFLHDRALAITNLA